MTIKLRHLSYLHQEDDERGIKIWGMYTTDSQVLTVVGYYHPDRPNLPDQLKIIYTPYSKITYRVDDKSYNDNQISQIIKKKRKTFGRREVFNEKDLDTVAPGAGSFILSCLVMVRLSE